MGFGMLKQIWNFLKLFEGLVWVVKDQFLEDFLQVGEEILAVTAFDTRKQRFQAIELLVDHVLWRSCNLRWHFF